MRVIVANPPWKIGDLYGVRANSRWPHMRRDKVLPLPIWHAIAAAVLEEGGVEVKAIDAVERDMSIEKFVDVVKGFEPDIVFMETAAVSYKIDKETAAAVKNSLDTVLVFFGPHSTAFGEQIMKDCREIDIAVQGEYDYTFLDIANNLKDLNKVKGIIYRKEGDLITTPPRPLVDNLDELPLPARHLYPKHAYQEPLYKRPCYITYTSRGCPYGCSFCLWPATIHGTRFRYRSAKNVVDEMEYLMNNCGARSINIDDDTLTVNKRRVFEICDEIKRRGLDITWYCFSSTNIDDPELYKRMAEAGCEIVKFGVESSSNAALENVEKKLTVEQVRKGFRIAEKAGLKTMGSFIFGLPGETKEDVIRTIELSKELNPYFVQYSFMVPIPGTRLYKEGREKGWFRDNDLDFYAGSQRPVMVPKGATKEEISCLVHDAYKQFYIRPRYMLKVVKSVRSLDDIDRIVRGFYSIVKRFGI